MRTESFLFTVRTLVRTHCVMQTTATQRRIRGTNLYLCPELKRDAQALAKVMDISLSDLAERGLRMVMREQRRKERRAA